jgi:homoaconitate hydratase
MGQTVTEKITQRHAVGASGELHAGDCVTIRPKHVMTHDNTGAVIPKFKEIGASRIHDPSQPIFAIDHDIQNKTEKNLAKYAKIEAFAKENSIEFHPPGSGIAHQIMMERGHVLPGSLCVGSDSHSNMYGAVCAVGTPVVRTDAAAIWATGVFWWEIPPIARVVLEGKLPAGCSGKDVIVTLCGLYKDDEVLNHAVEFTGDGVAALSIEERMTISNMTTEWGALTGMFPCDETTMAFIRERPGMNEARIKEIEALDLTPDADARWAKTLHLDLAKVSPSVSGPNDVKTMRSVHDIEQDKVKIHKAYLVSCVNSRLEDLTAAAKVLEGKHVAEGVDFYVAAASAGVEKQARESGVWASFEKAGAHFLPPGCGPCIGLGSGTLEDGEVGISATNRNFRGRMGSRDAIAYLASPEVVAASAAAGHICGPRNGAHSVPPHRVEIHDEPPERGGVEIIEGFPAQMTGEALYLPKDNLNTDGIYGAAFTYKDDMTPKEMAEVIFLNYDEDFHSVGRPGDILVGGSNFGTGSSREQAATALKHFGIQLVIAVSFSQTYKRNAFNNAFVCIECPKLVAALAEANSGSKEKTIRSGWALTVDFTKGRVTANGKNFPFIPLGDVPQRLIVAGGAEAMARLSLAAAAA